MYYSRFNLLPKPKKRVRYRNKRITVLAAFMVLVLAVVFAVNLISTFRSIHNSANWARELRMQKSGDERVYLLYGIDYWGANPYVDCLLMLYHDTVEQSISLLYIPGNTMIKAEGNSPASLGSLYRRLEEPAFIDLVQELTGITVHHYITLHYQGIVALGDYLGGIQSIDLDEAGTGINLLPQEGERLGGFELYRYFLAVNFREPPWAQLSRQQKVLVSLWSKMEQKKFWHWPKMVRLLSPYVQTDLTWRELTSLKGQFLEYGFAEMKQLLLPGEEKIVEGSLYWVPDDASLTRLFNKNGSAIPAKVRVEVLNGSGIKGRALEVARLLEQKGFQVVATGNADRFNYSTTQVIALGEDVEKARAAAFHIPGAGVSMLHRHDPAAQVDVRVIVGGNYVEQSEKP